MKKLLIFLVIAFLVTGCKTKDKAITPLSGVFDYPNLGEQQHEYDSPYTICYKNDDGTYSTYIYSSPIQYLDGNDYKLIDNSLIKSRNENYAYENKANCIKVYFPKELTTPLKIVNGSNYMEVSPDFDIKGFSIAKKKIYKNMYNDIVEAIIYEREDINLVFYATKAGIKSEICLNKNPKNNIFIFNIKTPASSGTSANDKYIIFKDNDIQSVIYGPLVKDSSDIINGDSNHFNIYSKIYLNTNNVKQQVNIEISENMLNSSETVYPVRFDPSFEIYLDKLPDSAVSSQYPENDRNEYLRNFCIIGESIKNGTGELYMRYRLRYFLDVQDSDIISTKYNIKRLYNTTKEIPYLTQVNDQWSSINLKWIQKPSCTNDKIIGTNIPNNYLEFDITDFAKACFSDNTSMTESLGLSLKKGGDYDVYATNDNTLYAPYTVITTSKAPKGFEKHLFINPKN